MATYTFTKDPGTVKSRLAENAPQCPFCVESYVYSAEYRCVVCGGAVCKECAHVTEGQQPVCPDCHGPHEK